MPIKTLTTFDINAVIEKLTHSPDEIKDFRRIQPALAASIDDIIATMEESKASPQAWAMLIANFVYSCAEQANATDT